MSYRRQSVQAMSRLPSAPHSTITRYGNFLLRPHMRLNMMRIQGCLAIEQHNKQHQAGGAMCPSLNKHVALFLKSPCLAVFMHRKYPLPPPLLVMYAITRQCDRG